MLGSSGLCRTELAPASVIAPLLGVFVLRDEEVLITTFGSEGDRLGLLGSGGEHEPSSL